jgi:hypothetical protein
MAIPRRQSLKKKKPEEPQPTQAAPKYKLQSTGEEKPGVYDPNKQTYVSPFSQTELLASKKLKEQQQKVALENEILRQGEVSGITPKEEEKPTEEVPVEEQPQVPQTKAGAAFQRLSGIKDTTEVTAGEMAGSYARGFSILYLAARNALVKGSLDYTKAQESYTGMKTQISKDMDLVRQGLVGADEVDKEIQQLEIYNNALGGSAKKWYNKNVVYWADNNGAAIQEEFEINNRAIQSLYTQLEQAKRQGQLNSLVGVSSVA